MPTSLENWVLMKVGWGSTPLPSASIRMVTATQKTANLETCHSRQKPFCLYYGVIMDFWKEADIRRSIIYLFGHSVKEWKRVYKVLKKMIKEESTENI